MSYKDYELAFSTRVFKKRANISDLHAHRVYEARGGDLGFFFKNISMLGAFYYFYSIFDLPINNYKPIFRLLIPGLLAYQVSKCVDSWNILFIGDLEDLVMLNKHDSKINLQKIDLLDNISYSNQSYFNALKTEALQNAAKQLGKYESLNYSKI